MFKANWLDLFWRFYRLMDHVLKYSFKWYSSCVRLIPVTNFKYENSSKSNYFFHLKHCFRSITFIFNLNINEIAVGLFNQKVVKPNKPEIQFEFNWPMDYETAQQTRDEREQNTCSRTEYDFFCQNKNRPRAWKFLCSFIPAADISGSKYLVEGST